MQENQIQVFGFEHLRDLYETDIDFQQAQRACKNPVEVDREPWMEYNLQDGLLFKNSKLCVPRCSMRENLIHNKHNGGMAGHFGSDKTIGQLSHFYVLPRMRYEVENFVSICRVCEHAKGRIQDT